MDDNEHKKTVKDLAKTFDTNPKKENQKVNPPPKKEKIPLFPTLKKLPNDVNNKFTKEKNHTEDTKIIQKNKPQAPF